MTVGGIERRATRAWRGRRLGSIWTWLLAVVVIVLGLGPVVLVVLNSFVIDVRGAPDRYGLDAWRTLLDDPGLLESLSNTAIIATARVAVGVPIAATVAWLLARSDAPGRSAFELLFWIAFFLPTVPVTLGWILLLDPGYGILNEVLARLPGQPSFDIYSLPGIVLVGVLNGTVPALVILMTPAFRLMNADLELSSRVAGAGVLRTLVRVSLPLVAPTLVVGAILAFVRSVESFEIEQLLGVPIGLDVYSTEVYRLVRFDPPRLDVASALGTVVLVILLPLVLLRSLVHDHATVGSRGFTVARIRLGVWRLPVMLGMTLLVTLSAIAPLIMLVLASFMTLFGFFEIAHPFTLDHWQRVLEHPSLPEAIRNTVVLGLGAGVIGACTLAVVAYVVVRGRTVSTKLIGTVTWVPWFLPGILLSLGLLWAYLANPVLRPLFGSLLGLILAIIIREMPFAVQILRGAFGQLGSELEDASRISGASWLRTFWRVVLPIGAPVVLTVGVLIALAAVRDVSTIILLSTQESRPLSILVLQFSTFGEIEAAAVTGLMMSAIVLVGALVGRSLIQRYAPR